MSDYYDVGGAPADGSHGDSVVIRNEFKAVQDGISKKLPVISGNSGKAIMVNAGATKLEAVTLTKTLVGLGNVDNTSDVNKPVSTAQATAINAKANKGANSDITSLSGLTTALSIAQGGTGGTTQATAQSALSVYSIAQTDAAIAAAGSLKSIDYTLSGNANTLKLNPTTLSFRSTTLTSGTPVSVSNAAQITTTISSGSTGGTISAQQSDIVLLAINNAGTMELAWTNLAGGLNLDETKLINTVAEGGAGAADSASTIYSTTARTGVAYKVVGIFRSTQTVAGTWAQAPALVQGIGGQALAALSSFGYGQTWQSFLGSRVSGTTYYNTTGKPIMVSVTGTAISTGWSMQAYVNGLQVYECYYYDAAYTHQDTVDLVVPPGHSYSVTNGGGFVHWVELR